MDELAVDSGENPGRPGSRCGTPSAVPRWLLARKGGLGNEWAWGSQWGTGSWREVSCRSIWGGNGGDVEGAELRAQTERGVRCCQEKMG